MIDVALLGRTPRLDVEEITVDCFRCFVETVSNRNEDESMIDDGPLIII